MKKIKSIFAVGGATLASLAIHGASDEIKDSSKRADEILSSLNPDKKIASFNSSERPGAVVLAQAKPTDKYQQQRLKIIERARRAINQCKINAFIEGMKFSAKEQKKHDAKMDTMMAETFRDIDRISQMPEGKEKDAALAEVAKENSKSIEIDRANSERIKRERREHEAKSVEGVRNPSIMPEPRGGWSNEAMQGLDQINADGKRCVEAIIKDAEKQLESLKREGR